MVAVVLRFLGIVVLNMHLKTVFSEEVGGYNLAKSLSADCLLNQTQFEASLAG